MNDDHGLLAKYNVPHIEIVEKTSVQNISVSLVVKDFPGFINRLREISEGGIRSFVRYENGREIEIKIVNLDSQKTKRMV